MPLRSGWAGMEPSGSKRAGPSTSRGERAGRPYRRRSEASSTRSRSAARDKPTRPQPVSEQPQSARHAPGDADDRTRGTLDALDGVELPHTGEPLELSRPAIAESDP